MHNLSINLPTAHYFKKLDTAAYGFAILFAFGLPWSNALFRIGLWGMAFCLLASLSWIKYWREALKNPIALTSIALFIWISIGAIYSTASSDLIRHDISHYRKLLALAPFIIICRSNQRRIILLISLFFGVAALMTPTILDAIGVHYFFRMPISVIANESYQAGSDGISKNLIYWKNHIVHGYFVCLLMTAAVIFFLTRNKFQKFYALITIICLYDLLLLIRGRTALICALIIIPFVFLFTAKSKTAKILIILGTIFTTLLTISIPGVKQRLDSIKIEVQSYSTTDSNTTSAGTRLHYWSISKDLFQKHPIFGTGPGGFRNELIINKDPLLSQNHFHAHNEFIVIASQSGIIGLIIFIALIYQIRKSAKASKHKEINYFGASFLLIFIVNSMTDASLFNDLEGWSFVIIAAAIASEGCFSNFSNTSKFSMRRAEAEAHI